MSVGAHVLLGCSVGFVLGIFVGNLMFSRTITDVKLRTSFKRHKQLIKRLRNMSRRPPSRTAYVHEVPDKNASGLNQRYFGRYFYI